jgi:hypothetical protein
MNVTYFRQRVDGPESHIEDAVVHHIRSLFCGDETPIWMGGSIPVGAGRPDLVAASCNPNVTALAQADTSTLYVLAYLRAVRRARIHTIAERTGIKEKLINRNLEDLVEAKAVYSDSNTYWLSPCWREIIRELVVIEAKVADWQKAVYQAARNQIFSHRSFVALPESLAKRVYCNSTIGKLGIGVLGVSEEHGVRVVRKSIRRKPRVWWYYYQIALIVAQHMEVERHAFCSPPSTGTK